MISPWERGALRFMLTWVAVRFAWTVMLTGIFVVVLTVLFG